MSTRRARKAAADEARSDAPAVPAAAPAAAAAASSKRKASAASNGEPADNAAPGESKMNRRQAKKAKVEAQSASVSEAARSALEAGQRSKSTKYRVRQREAAQQVKDSEERELEAFLFGGVEADAPMEEESDHEQHRPQPAKNVPVAAAASEDLFQIDTDGASAKKETAAVKSESKASSSGPAPAWVDEDDAGDQMVDLSSAARLRKLKSRAEERFITGKEYSKRLRQVYQEMNPGAESWAKESEPSDADLTQLLLQSTSNLTGAGTGVNGKLPGGAGRGEKLPSGSIELVRMKDANLVSPSQGVINSCKFHEGGQLMLTAGMDKMIRLFQIDGIENAKVQGVWLEDLPIISAEWLRSSSSSAPSAEIIASGRRTHFYSIDVASNKVTKVPNLKGREERSLEDMVVSPSGEYIAFLGNDGYILLVSGRTKQFIGSLKQNLNVASISFSADSSMIFSVGGEGIVYIWDVASRKCLYKHTDEGNIAGTAIAQDGGKGYYAVGSKSGAVNLYHTQQLSDRIASSSLATASASARLFASLTRPAPPPMKTFLNLTTPIDTLLFNCDSQLLLVGSRTTKDALKLVHVESQTVFANWPTSSTPLHFVSAVDFSPNSGYMSLANDRGRVLLYRLTHYPRA